MKHVGINCGTCDIALVGGVSITFPLASGYSYNEEVLFEKVDSTSILMSADGMIKGDSVEVIVIQTFLMSVESGLMYAVISGVKN